MSQTILITGATGNVGAELTRQLRQLGAPVVAAVRSPDKARRVLGDATATVAFDFARPTTFTTAFSGVRTLFLVRPPSITDTRRYITPAIVAARRAGVEHIVFLSLLGAEQNPIVPHYRIEQDLRESGLSWTFLRASFFLQNLDTIHRDDIRDGGDIFVPAGNGRTSFIDARDIAAVGALALTDDQHRNQAYALTGSAALSYREVARIFTEVLGRPIRYSSPGPLAFAARVRARGHAWSYILVMTAIYTAARLGRAATITPDATRLLGRPPISVRQYVEDYRRYWV